MEVGNERNIFKTKLDKLFPVLVCNCCEVKVSSEFPCDKDPETNKCSQEYHVACNHAKAKKIPVKFLPFIHAQQTKGNSRGAITVMDIMAADLSASTKLQQRWIAALDYFN